MAQDKMTLTILEDGTAKIEVEGISGANHVRADQLVRFFAGLMGGPLQIHKAPGSTHSHTHSHAHGKDHEHQH